MRSRRATGWLTRVQMTTGNIGCFGRWETEINLVWSEHEAKVDIVNRGRSSTSPVTHEVVRAWVSEVCAVLLRPERASKSHGSTSSRDYGGLVWDGSDLQGGFSGQVAWDSRSSSRM